MSNELVVIVGLGLLIFLLLFGGKLGMIAGALSAILIVGALRHPEIAPSGRQLEGSPEEQLQITLLFVALLIFPGMIWIWLRGLFRKGGRR